MVRRIVTLALFLASAVPAAAAERRFAVTDFDRLVVEGPYIVRVTAGRATSVVASGGQEGLDRLSIDVTGQVLRIRRNRTYWGGNPEAQQGPVTVELVTPGLRSARLVGPARVEIDRVEGLRADLAVEGSGRLRVHAVEADNLSVGLAGAGRIDLAGAAKRLTADLQGTGDFDASRLRAEDATIMSGTSGSVAAAVSRSVTVSAFGLGTVEISGRPACTVRGPSADLVRCGAPGALPR